MFDTQEEAAIQYNAVATAARLGKQHVIYNSSSTDTNQNYLHETIDTNYKFTSFPSAPNNDANLTRTKTNTTALAYVPSTVATVLGIKLKIGRITKQIYELQSEISGKNLISTVIKELPFILCYIIDNTLSSNSNNNFRKESVSKEIGDLMIEQTSLIESLKEYPNIDIPDFSSLFHDDS